MTAYTWHALAVLDTVLVVLVLAGVVGLFLIPPSPGHVPVGQIDRRERKRRTQP